jgi:hypothetical protein
MIHDRAAFANRSMIQAHVLFVANIKIRSKRLDSSDKQSFIQNHCAIPHTIEIVLLLKYTAGIAQLMRGASKMDIRGKDFVCWMASGVALLIVAAVVVDYFINAGKGEPVIPVIPLLFAGAIWLAGWAYGKIGATRETDQS